MSTQTNKGITYELALELKQAGFPLPEYPETIIGTRGSEPLKLKGIIQEPTLSELIEACGDEFDLTNCKGCVSSRGCKEPWIAEKWYGTDKPQDIAQGKTREEAVARLWLKLNE